MGWINIEPKVSIIIPTYNRSTFLKRAIESVFNQTYQDFELIVVDDHSKDDTKQIVESLKDNRLLYIRNESNLGGSVSRNIGIKNSNCSLVAFLDDDDEWHPRKLEKQIRIIKNLSNDYCGVYTGMIYYKNGKIIKKTFPKKDGNLFSELLKRNYIGSTSVIMLRKKALDDVGYFNERLPASQDLELYLRLSEKYKFKSIEEPLVNYHLHSDKQIRDDKSGYLFSTKYIYEKYQSKIVENNLQSDFLYNLAILSLRNGKTKIARNYLKNCIKLSPMNIKYYFVYFITYISSKIYFYLLKNINFA